MSARSWSPRGTENPAAAVLRTNHDASSDPGRNDWDEIERDGDQAECAAPGPAAAPVEPEPVEPAPHTG